MTLCSVGFLSTITRHCMWMVCFLYVNGMSSYSLFMVFLLLPNPLVLCFRLWYLCCIVLPAYFLWVTHCGQVPSYGTRGLYQFCFWWGLVARQHKSITWTNIDYSLVGICGIGLQTISQLVAKLLCCIISFKMILLKLLLHLIEANELSWVLVLYIHWPWSAERYSMKLSLRLIQCWLHIIKHDTFKVYLVVDAFKWTFIRWCFFKNCQSDLTNLSVCLKILCKNVICLCFYSLKLFPLGALNINEHYSLNVISSSLLINTNGCRW